VCGSVAQIGTDAESHLHVLYIMLAGQWHSEYILSLNELNSFDWQLSHLLLPTASVTLKPVRRCESCWWILDMP